MAIRSRSASTPQRLPAATSSSLSGQRSGRASPSCWGLAPFSAIEPVLSPIARIASTSSAREPQLRRQRGELGALLLDRAGALAGLLDQGRHHALDRGVGEVPLAGELHRRQAGPLGDRPQPLEPLAARLDPARRAGRPGGRPSASSRPRPQVAPEEAAVVDDPGDHVDPVLGGRLEGELARPRLERVEDHHRPVDPVAEALDAVDQVEGEAVGGPGGDADRAPPAPPRAAPPSRPRPPRSCSRCGRGCGAAAGRRNRAPIRSRLRSVAIRRYEA